MQRSKFLTITLLMAAAVFLASPSGEALVKKPPAKGSKSATTAKTGKSATKATPKSSTKTATKAVGKKPGATKTIPAKSVKEKHGKKTPYILTPEPEVSAPEMPHAHRFSPEFCDALSRGDLTQAYHDLQIEAASDKVGYMINQVLMAQGKGMGHGQTISSFDRGIAWHNLYLFLARQGRPAPKFVKVSARYYQKAARKTGYADKANVLLAALYATAGDTAKAGKYIAKVNEAALAHSGEDYNGLEYLATYYAAVKQPQKVITYLDKAYQLNPGSLLQWLHVGDDFWAVEDDALFQEQVAQWTTQHHQRLTQLQRDKSSHDSRKKAALAPKKKYNKKKTR